MTTGDRLRDLSREVTLSCDANGIILSADQRALRSICAEPGKPFAALAAPGTEEKARALIERARDADVHDWEVPLVCAGLPATYSFHALRDADGIHLLGIRLPDGFGTTLQQLNDSMSDVVGLNREIARQKRELQVAYRDLDESNRGVLSLHSELEDKAAALQRTADVRARVVANVSHEFRTPLHTILGLSKLLLDPAAEPLTDEQKRQLRYIRQSAEELYEMVNDLLDLSKAESGKMQLRPSLFDVSQFFSAIRGQLRPILPEKSRVELVFEEPDEPIALETDQTKLAQILRNLITNALKFTQQGSVRVRAAVLADFVAFSVTDTGIGIAPEDQDRIFEEFNQLDHPLQRQVKGTGLGLALSRRLAALLGGELRVDSELGRGSTFTVKLPAVHPEVSEMNQLTTRPLDPARAPVLVVEDDRKTIFVYERYLAMAGFQVLPARTIDEARGILQRHRPAAVVLDIMLEQETTWEFLSELKQSPETQDIPVLVVTVASTAQKARALGADEFWLKPLDQDRLIRKLKQITGTGTPARVLVIDDDERSRYLVQRLLQGSPYVFSEATGGWEGVRAAREQRPSVILLDFLLQDVTAFDVIDELKADPRTRGIPVIVITSHMLDEQSMQRLAAETDAIVSKENLSRELAINRIRDALSKAGVRHTRQAREPHERA